MPPPLIKTLPDDNKSLASSGEGSESTGHGSRTEGSSTRDSFGFGESLHVSRSKICVYVSLIGAGIVISISAYLFVKRQEQGNFETEVSLVWCCWWWLKLVE